jgi:hypothetical protein
MIWHFIRAGWPNAAVIFALAVLPLVSIGLHADLGAAGLPTIEAGEYAGFGEPEEPAPVAEQK